MRQTPQRNTPIHLGGLSVGSWSDVAKNAGNDAKAALLNGGKLILGTTGMANVLAEMTFANPAFGPSVVGVATANPLVGDLDANNTGIAVEFEMRTSAGVLVYSGTVGGIGSEEDIELARTNITIGNIMDLTNITIQ